MGNDLSPALLVIVRALIKYGHSGTLTAAQAREMTLGDLDECARLASGRELVEAADGKQLESEVKNGYDKKKMSEV